MAQGNLEHRIFAYDCFVRNGESVIAVQRKFHRRFKVHRNESVPSRNTVLRWVTNFRAEGWFSTLQLMRVDANFRTRLQHCINENGHHLLDVIFCV